MMGEKSEGVSASWKFLYYVRNDVIQGLWKNLQEPCVSAQNRLANDGPRQYDAFRK